MQCSVPAGSMVVWDNSIWHTATSNFSGRDRVGHIAGYGAISARLGRRSVHVVSAGRLLFRHS